MRKSRVFSCCLTLLLAAAACAPLHAQLGFDIDVKKPAPYEDRVLRAEKSGDKKLKNPGKFFQNLTTHYNYFFNANNKLNEVIERAKQSHVDDYSTLLPFYNFSLDATAQEKVQLDSVIYKSQTAIVMHDLRNDWVDNMYMLWGAAYYFLQEFDSASLMFQFINYAFAEKEKDGYYRYIGSRMDGNNALSISTKEDNSFLKRTFSVSPSRNDAFIWQIRSLIERGDFTYSGSIIATLKEDPLFPERLHDHLEEVQAYWFYKQQIWDSSATHLLKALGQAKTKQEKARWEYLAAQMFEKAGKSDQAQELYAKARAHTTDPVMDVYARLNLVRLNAAGEGDIIGRNVEELVKMAKRDKYDEYRDVIYYMAAQMELERKNYYAAQDYLQKAAKYNRGNLSSRSRIFLQIADIAYDQKKYVTAASYYDSIQVSELKDQEVQRVNERKAGLAKVVVQDNILKRQDSLLKVAALPEEERRNYINKLVKQLRKQQGLDDNNSLSSGRAPASNTPPPSLFDNSGKGEWYFYNGNLKTQGNAQFKQTWGNRPNVDNWRRFASISSQQSAIRNQQPGKTPGTDLTQTVVTPGEDDGPSYNSLLANLPLDEAGKAKSNDSVMNALFNLGVIFNNDLEDYPSAIESLEELITKFPSFGKMDEALFQLYYAYNRMGNREKANGIRNLMARQHKDSRFTSIVTTGKDPESKTADVSKATKEYEGIYDMFIEGRFNEALAAKKIADSVYQTNRWQPQLLYIEAVYHIRQRDDSVATQVLQTLVTQNTGTPLADKAQNMIDVLKRRKEIEDELRALEIQRPVDSFITITEPLIVQKPEEKPKTEEVKPEEKKPEEKKPEVQPEEPRTTTTRNTSIAGDTKKPVNINPANVPVDTATKRPIAAVKKETMFGYSYDPNEQHMAVLVLDKVDAVFSGEARNAFNRYNREKYYNKPITSTTIELSPEKKLVLFSGFANAQDAMNYVDQARKLAASEIVPWLKAEKYSFLILSQENLPVLEENKDLTLYRRFLEQYLPGKF